VARAAEGNGLRPEAREGPHEDPRVAETISQDVEASAVGRWTVAAYLWLMSRAPSTTRGRVVAAAIVVAIVMAPSVATLYVSLETGQQATESWFGRLGYGGVFLANLASTATVFIPVPVLTAAAQALIVSSSHTLSPVGVGIAGGLGMAIGEITAYVAGSAASFIAKEEEIKAPGRLQPLMDRLTRGVIWLMHHFGMLTLYVLSAVPNFVFEFAGLTAGATRYAFWKFLTAVTAGKITRGLLLAYIGEKLIFG
jgi:membrane protein DedA with SNARE-associated domain